MVGIEWTEQALNDLKSIAEYISLDSLTYARLFIEQIIRKAEHLSLFPTSGRIVPELNNSRIRELLSGNYRMIYRYENDLVQILTVYHSARILDDLD